MELKREAEDVQENSKRARTHHEPQIYLFLPLEILREIFKYLPLVNKALHIRGVCKDWKLVIEQYDEFWKDLAIKNWKDEEESQYLPATNWFQR